MDGSRGRGMVEKVMGWDIRGRMKGAEEKGGEDFQVGVCRREFGSGWQSRMMIGRHCLRLTWDVILAKAIRG